MKLLGKEKAT